PAPRTRPRWPGSAPSTPSSTPGTSAAPWVPARSGFPAGCGGGWESSVPRPAPASDPKSPSRIVTSSATGGPGPPGPCCTRWCISGRPRPAAPWAMDGTSGTSARRSASRAGPSRASEAILGVSYRRGIARRPEMRVPAMSKRIVPDDPAIPPETESALKLWVVLSRAHASISSHAVAHAAEHGLSLTEFAILEALYHRGRMVLGEIQRRILVSSGGITFLVDRLAEKGLVVRQECLEDRRAKYVALTREGTRLIRDLFPSHARTNAEQEEATQLLRTLGLTAAGGGLPPSSGNLRRKNGAKPASRSRTPAT